MTESVYTRREIAALTPELMSQYHALIMANDLAGFEKLMDVNRIPTEIRQELREDFTRYAERILRRRWRGPR
jgi:hypothetical protein